MADHNGRNQLTFLSDRFKKLFDHQRNIPRRPRSLVEYFNCPGHESPDTAAKTAPPATNDHPDAEMANADDPPAHIPPAPANSDDPEAVMSPAAATGEDPDAEMANADDPLAHIPPAPANGDDPEPVMSPAAATCKDPDAEMANGDDPAAGISAVAAENGDDPDVEMANGDDPDGEIQGAEEDGGAEMPAEMRAHVIERMGGHRVQMIIEKELTATDMRTDQGRLMLPPMQVRVNFVTEEEERKLQHRAGEGEAKTALNYIETWIVGPDLRVRPIWFKKWRFGSKYSYCLMHEWNSFARTYGLKAGNTVRVWSFRVDRRDDQNNVKSELHFALLNLSNQRRRR